MKTVKFFIISIIFFYSSNLSYAQDHPRVLLNSDSISIINAKINNPSNEYSYRLYQKLREQILPYANYTSILPSFNKLLYTIFSDVAFVALLENNDSWKDNMISVAMNFDNNFDSAIEESAELEIDGRGFRGEIWNSCFATIAAALIFDYCYERLSPIQKDYILQYIFDGIEFQRDFVMDRDSYYIPEHRFYRYNSWHELSDPSFVLGGMAIAGETLSNGDTLYSWTEFINDLDSVKTNNFDPEYGLFRYMWGDNGVHLDGAGYFGINFGRMYLLLQALTNYEGIDYFNLPVVKESLGEASKWITSDLFPNRSGYGFFFNGLNTSGVVLNNTYINLLVLAQKYQDGIARWLFDEGFGAPFQILFGNHFHPEIFIPSLIIYKEFPASFPDIDNFSTFIDFKRGLLNWKTGWNNDDLLFSIESTPVHHLDSIVIRKTQADKGSITLTAYGKNLIFDPNGGHYAPHFLTDANNYINVEKDGTLFGESTGNGNGFYHNDGQISNYEKFDFFETVKTRNKNAFDTVYARYADELYIIDENNPDPIGNGIVNSVLKANREVYYFKIKTSIPYYFWVIDEIQKSNDPVDYDWHICAKAGYTINTSGNPIKIYHGSNPATLDVFIVKPDFYTCQISHINKSQGQPHTDAEKLSVLQNAVKGNYNILLVPYTNTTPSKNYTKLTMNQGSGAVLNWGCGYDDYFFYSSSNTISSPLINSDAKTVFFRKKNSNGNYIQYFMREGSSLVFDNTTIVDLYGNTGRVICDSQEVNVFGNDINESTLKR